MKKIITLVPALMLVFVLAACGVGNDTSDSSDDIVDIDGISTTAPGTPQQQPSDMPNSQDGSPYNTDDISVVTGEVTVEGEKVIYTTYDGLGNISVMEYIYDGSVLSKIVLTMKCADSSAAKSLYDQMMGEAKAMTEETYSNVELDGKNVVCAMNEGMVNTFVSFSQEDLAALLRNETTNTSSDSENTVISIMWSDIPLPSGFPTLAEGVTSYTQAADNIISLEWNVMTVDEVNTMLPAIEKWANGKFEVFGDETYMNWSLSTDTHYISIAYFEDHSFVSQVAMSISVW